MNTRRKQRGFEVQDVDVQVKTSEKLVTCQKAGASYGKMCFSHDSRYLFCCYGSDIRVVSNTSGECLHDLKHHTKTVTGILVNPGNVLQLYSCGKDKLLIVWDYLDGAKLKEYNLHSPLYGIVSADENSIIMIAEGIAKENQLQGLPSVQPKDKRDALKLWTQLHSAALGHAKYRILQWKKTNDTKSQFENPKRLIEDCSANSGLVSFGCSKKIVASAMSTELTIYFMKSDEQIVLKDDNKFTKAYTCVACHPNEEVVAAGLNNGMIYLWHIKGRNGVKSCIHWHSLPLLCLAYTPDGSHLLSGGHECVLVKWPTHRLQEKTFKPRMGAPLTQLLVAPDGLHTASQHLDNAIQLLDNNLKVLQVYQGMTRSWLTGNPVSCGLTFDPDSQSLVTNGMPGHLQFFSPALNKQLFNLDIVGENYISPENLQDGPTVTKIHCMALSASGRWLATYQSWDDGKFTPELKLKFWQWKSEAETYVLNTTVESPHDDHVTFMMFRPLTTNQSQDNLELLTLGADACFKCWGLMDDTDIYRSNQRWDCDYVGQHRGLRVVAADFSPDGTALAVGFEHLVTLWNPDLYKVQATLAQATEGRPAVSHVLFGSKDCSHNLVVATNMTLVIWDLRTLTIQWQLDHNITHLLRDPATNLMAYIIDEQSLCVFSPASPTPVYQHGALACSVLSAVFIPGGEGGAASRGRMARGLTAVPADAGRGAADSGAAGGVGTGGAGKDSRESAVVGHAGVHGREADEAAGAGRGHQGRGGRGHPAGHRPDTQGPGVHQFYAPLQ